MIVEIKHTATGAALYTATIPDDHPYGRAVLLGLAVREAVKNRADLYGADLAGADLYGANLAGANLTGADITGANLRGADLYGANLTGANLTGANLTGANLTGANLRGAIWAEGVTLEAAPLCLTGLRWPVWVLDTHMQIGCELHTFEEWEGFDDRAIAAMDGAKARRFWDEYREPLLAMCATRKAKAEAA